MKPILLLLLFLLFYSCRKELTIEEKLSGKWELRKSVGGWPGTITYSPANGNTVEFTKMTYARYSNGQLDESGTYSIIKDSLWGKLADRIIYNGIAGYPRSFISIENDKLSFYSDIIDGGSSRYELIK
jgi:hypothetical protein